MCGILVFREKGNNKTISRRGQDKINTVKLNGYTFVHSLLSITGEFVPQPYIDGDIVALYNGEIYNHKYKKSDGEVIIPLYKKYGEDFPKYLDGEFAIALYDFAKQKVLYITDPFATKPLYTKGWECGSYKSGVGGKRLKHGRIRRVTKDKETEWSWHEFDFDNQYKDTYEDWIQAFQKSIEKRKAPNCFLGMSSGYDSGAIACELERQGADYKAYTIYGTETPSVIDKRREIVNTKTVVADKGVRDYILENAEPYTYRLYYNGWRESEMFNDKAVLGLGKICEVAKKENRRVYLSGQGADEIFSDYKLFPVQSELKGEYPERLKVWRSFYGNFQEAYIAKEEHIAGSYSIETRYPFLDTKVVQEFLWLRLELKNKWYKAPIRAYLDKYKFPYEVNKKVGFNPI